MFAHCLYNNYSYSHLKFEISLMNLKTSGQSYRSPTLSTDSPCPKAKSLVTTANVTPKHPIQILYYLPQLQMISNNM